MGRLLPIFQTLVLIINVFSIIVLCVGIILCIYNLIRLALFRTSKNKKVLGIQHIKTHLGSFVLLGLEILIVADIIETILKPTLEDILHLAAIVAIRTVISLFLNKEIKEIKEREEAD
ncbi:MAG TPA: DUF1622 domain-containing protein [Oscillospiraceae bacterium]|nr:DUF1622 domain-containing protein [Oscillospiraceae bacterium]